MSVLFNEKVFYPGDIVSKRYGTHYRLWYVIENRNHIQQGYYLCYDLGELDYAEIFLGYDKKSNKVKKVA